MVEFGSAITSIGAYLPERVIPNSYFVEELKLNTSDEWIIRRTGIKSRHWAEADQATSDLATLAACDALTRAGRDAKELDALLVATATPDHQFPGTACLVQANIGAENAAPLDLGAACSGTIAGLWIAKALIESGLREKVLLIGAEKLSSVLDLKDRGTSILFGDGAGAFLVEKVKDPGIFEVIYRGDGTKSNLISVPAGGSRKPASPETVAKGQHYLTMEGTEVYKLAAPLMEKVTLEVLKKSGLSIEDINFVIPHQANERIMQMVFDNLHVPPRKRISTVAGHGNTSAASIPLAVYQAYMEEKIKPKDKLLFAAVGSGVTYGAAIVEWRIE